MYARLDAPQPQGKAHGAVVAITLLSRAEPTVDHVYETNTHSTNAYAFDIPPTSKKRHASPHALTGHHPPAPPRFGRRQWEGRAEPIASTCLTEDWVKTMEASLKVNAQERDSKGRLKNPFLRAASQFPRYKLDDARTQDPNAYSAECMPAKTTFYGVVAKFDDITGDLLTSGLANGSVILELNEWTTHSLSTMTLAILAAEVYDYPVSLYSTEATLSTTERMSSAPAGLCTPTHVNLEVWPGMEALLQVYANESSVVGPIGYVAQSGLYTTIDFVKDSFDYVKYSELLNADFWRSYTVLDKLIDSVSYADFASSAYFPTGNAVCTDNTMGCQNYCFKSNACKLREANGKNCIVVIMMSPNWDPGYLQASMSNVGMPAYFCFLGFGGTQNYVLAMQQANKPVLFYHYEPELFHFNNPGLFQRVTSSNSRTSQVEQGHFRRERLWRTY